jgi:hypothetical protein
MRGLGAFFGTERRNNPVRLLDRRPQPSPEERVSTGNALQDGFTVLSRSAPDRQGTPPPVAGQSPFGNHQGPDDSFEQ